MISIIIPTYNERENVEILLFKLSKIGKKFQENFEIVVVDDNSPDETAKTVERLKKRLPIRLLVRKDQRGLTSAIMHGVKNAKGGKIIVMDADLSHPPEKVVDLAKSLENADLVIGSRNINGSGVEDWPFHRKIVSDGATILARLVIKHKVSDPMSGFFAIRKSILIKTPIKVKGYKILMNILAKNPDIRIKEIPYMFKTRGLGKSKLDIKEVVTFLSDIIRLMFM